GGDGGEGARVRDLAVSRATERRRARRLDVRGSSVHSAERVYQEQLDALDGPWAWDWVPVLAELRAEARRRGLWNLFLPGEHGAGLTNLQYAPLAEITGRSPLAPPALNCSAPDPGNMEVL